MKFFEEFNLFEDLWNTAHDDTCDVCKSKKHAAINSFGQYLCNDCDEDYLKSEKGRLETFIQIALGVVDANKLSDVDLAQAAKSYSKYRLDLSSTLVSKEIE